VAVTTVAGFPLNVIVFSVREVLKFVPAIVTSVSLDPAEGLMVATSTGPVAAGGVSSSEQEVIIQAVNKVRMIAICRTTKGLNVFIVNSSSICDKTDLNKYYTANHAGL
jgi:hypothetical protein